MARKQGPGCQERNEGARRTLPPRHCHPLLPKMLLCLSGRRHRLPALQSAIWRAVSDEDRHCDIGINLFHVVRQLAGFGAVGWLWKVFGRRLALSQAHWSSVFACSSPIIVSILLGRVLQYEGGCFDHVDRRLAHFVGGVPLVEFADEPVLDDLLAQSTAGPCSP